MRRSIDGADDGAFGGFSLDGGGADVGVDSGVDDTDASGTLCVGFCGVAG